MGSVSDLVRGDDRGPIAVLARGVGVSGGPGRGLAWAGRAVRRGFGVSDRDGRVLALCLVLVELGGLRVAWGFWSRGVLAAELVEGSPVTIWCGLS